MFFYRDAVLGNGHAFYLIPPSSEIRVSSRGTKSIIRSNITHRRPRKHEIDLHVTEIEPLKPCEETPIRTQETFGFCTLFYSIHVLSLIKTSEFGVGMVQRPRPGNDCSRSRLSPIPLEVHRILSPRSKQNAPGHAHREVRRNDIELPEGSLRGRTGNACDFRARKRLRHRLHTEAVGSPCARWVRLS